MTMATEPAPIALDGTEDDVMSLADLARDLRLHYSTIHRWAFHTTPALPTLERAGRTVTTKAAYYRWLAAQNGRTDG